MDNEIAFSHKVNEIALTCIKINSNGGAHHNVGKLVAIGDQDGTVTLLELCDSLCQLQLRENDVMNEIFDRESRKEQILEAIEKQQDLMKKKWEQRKAELINEAEKEFSQIVKKDEEAKLQIYLNLVLRLKKNSIRDDKKLQSPKHDDKQQQQGDGGQQQDQQDQGQDQGDEDGR